MSVKSLETAFVEAAELAGLRPKDKMTLKGRTMWFSDGVGEVLVYETNNGCVLNHRGKEYKSASDLMEGLGSED